MSSLEHLLGSPFTSRKVFLLPHRKAVNRFNTCKSAGHESEAGAAVGGLAALEWRAYLPCCVELLRAMNPSRNRNIGTELTPWIAV
jgi:hypothetical protein